MSDADTGHRSGQEPKAFQTQKDIEDMLMRTFLKNRSATNQRLVETFKVDNPFTTGENEWRNAFKNEVSRILNLARDQWPQMRQRIDILLRKILDSGDIVGGISLVSLVQTSVFTAVLPMLFPDQGLYFFYELLMDNDTVKYDETPAQKKDREARKQREGAMLKACEKAAHLINELWMLSKVEYPNEKQSKEKSHYLDELQQALSMIFGSGYHKEGKENPLNLIIPAYETIWRVVFRIVVEVYYRECHAPEKCRDNRQQEWLNALERAYNEENLTGDFLRSDGEATCTVSDIVREGLRLYPPSRHIHREKKNERLVADIEYMHRNQWPNGKSFDPSRWKDTKQDENTPFHPFGYGAYSCAAKTAGPTIIGVLVVSLVHGLRSRDLKPDCRDDESQEAVSGTKPLTHERTSYREFYVKKPETS